MKTIKYLLAAICAITIWSCDSKQTPLQAPLQAPHTELFDGYSVTTFYTRVHWEVDRPAGFTVKIIGETAPVVLDLSASCEYKKDHMKVSITIPSEHVIEDGYYVLISPNFLGKIAKRYRIEFKGGKIGTIDDVDDDLIKEGYGQYLEGAGSQADPFRIVDSKTFNDFLGHLAIDTLQGRGYYFQQTADINWSSGTSESNRTLGNLTFAGSYDGNGKSISNLNYIGGGDGSKDSDRGLFKSLTNGAEIKNIFLKNITFTNTHSRVGAVAGNATQLVILENVAVSGNLQGVSSVGGFIGSANKAESLTIKNCLTNLSIQSTNGQDVGGAVGKVENSKINIIGLSTATSGSLDNFSLKNENIDPYADIFQVYTNAGKFIGGAIGRVVNTTFTIENVTLLHSSNKYNDDIKIIYGKAGLGGVIGSLESLSGKSAIKNCDIALIITSDNDNNIGGYIGMAELKHNLEMTNNHMCGPIKGNTSVGGGIGMLKLTESGVTLSVDGFTFGAHEKLQTPYYCTGNIYVGGFAGHISGTGASSSTISVNNLTIAANVTSPQTSESYGSAGGFAGYVTKTGITWKNSCVGTGSIEIKGPFKVGGLIGELNEGSLTADNSYTLNKTTPTIPAESSLKKNFYGKVLPFDTGSGTRYIGGAIGNVIKSPVSGLHIHATVTGTGNYTGGVAGYISFDNDLTMNDCSFAGELWAIHNAGGVVGEIQKRGKVTECINYGSINGSNQLGGVVGRINYDDDEPYVNYCVNLGSVTGVKYVGGIAGYMAGTDRDWCKIHNSANYGTIIGNSNESSPYSGVGGILGKGNNRKCEVKFCVNFGTVKGSGTNVCVGGIAGKMGSGSLDVSLNVSLRESANYGEISSSTADSYVGGVLGYLERANEWNEDNSITENCYNAGYIPSKLDNDPGGIVGCSANQSLIRKCVNYGNVPHGNGIMGTQDGNGNYSDCYTLYNTYKEGESTNIWPKHVNIFYTDNMNSQSYWDDTALNFSETWILKNGKAELRNCPFQYSKAPEK